MTFPAVNNHIFYALEPGGLFFWLEPKETKVQEKIMLPPLSWLF